MRSLPSVRVAIVAMVSRLTAVGTDGQAPAAASAADSTLKPVMSGGAYETVKPALEGLGIVPT